MAAVPCLLLALVLLSVSFEKSLGMFNPYREGPMERKNVVVGINHAEDLHFELYISAPVAEGSYPVIYFLGGFHMNVPSFVYNDLLDRLASFGIIAVSMWRFTVFSDDETTTERIRRVISYVEQELPNELKLEDCPFDFHCPDEWVQFPENFSVNNDGFYLASHSSGAPEVVVAALSDVAEGRARTKGLVLMSPVDGGDPWGIFDDFVTPEEGQLPINAPSLILMAGLDNVPGQDLPFFPPCAPEDLSNTRFYNALNTPKWLVNATEFGHGDVTAEFFADFIAFTGICKGGEASLDRLTYKTFVVGQVISFIRAIENPEKDCDMLAYLEDVDMMLQDNVVVLYDKGDSQSECPFRNSAFDTTSHQLNIINGAA